MCLYEEGQHDEGLERVVLHGALVEPHQPMGPVASGRDHHHGPQAGGDPATQNNTGPQVKTGPPSPILKALACCATILSVTTKLLAFILYRNNIVPH